MVSCSQAGIPAARTALLLLVSERRVPCLTLVLYIVLSTRRLIPRISILKSVEEPLLLVPRWTSGDLVDWKVGPVEASSGGSAGGCPANRKATLEGNCAYVSHLRSHAGHCLSPHPACQGLQTPAASEFCQTPSVAPLVRRRVL